MATIRSTADGQRRSPANWHAERLLAISAGQLDLLVRVCAEHAELFVRV